MIGPRVSVVVPAYNCAKYLAACIGSALGQEGPEVEVVVVNDGSPDDTDAVVEPFLDRIKYIRQENRGLSGARNRGFRESEGEFVCFLDADDLLLPGKFFAQLERFNAEPDLGVVISGYEEVAEDGETLLVAVEKRWNRDGLGRLLRHEVFPCHTALLRREALERSSLFPEDIPRDEYQEDWQLWLEIALEGVEFGSVVVPTCRYRNRSGSGRQAVLRHMDGARRVVRWLRSHPRYGELRDEIECLHVIVEMERVARAFYCGDLEEAEKSLVREASAHPDFWTRPATMLRLFERTLSPSEGGAWGRSPDLNLFESRILGGVIPLASGLLPSALQRGLSAAALLMLAELYYMKGSHAGTVTMVRRAIFESPSVVSRWGRSTAIRAAVGPRLGSILGAMRRAVFPNVEWT
jgi:glycosyltransferase involved in cell wall biosynthesis